MTQATYDPGGIYDGTYDDQSAPSPPPPDGPATLVAQQIDLDGADITFGAATDGGDTFTPGPGMHLRVRNGSGSIVSATVQSFIPCNQGFHHDIVMVVGVGEELEAGPFGNRFADPSGLAHIAWSTVVGVTVALAHLAQVAA